MKLHLRKYTELLPMYDTSREYFTGFKPQHSPWEIRETVGIQLTRHYEFTQVTANLTGFHSNKLYYTNCILPLSCDNYLVSELIFLTEE